jgi:methionine--tRNA ligase beta chain
MRESVSFSDFLKLDLRIGKVLEVERLVGSDNLLKMKVDLGREYGIKQILAGLAKKYKPQQLKGKKFIFVANLAPKKMMEEVSNGMILCADFDGTISIIPVSKKIIEGAVVR